MEMDSWKGATIKVIGLGGAGSNAVDRMIQMGIPGVDFIAANSDIQALGRSEAPCKIRLGDGLTGAMGAGGNPAIGAKAAYECREQLANALRGADMVFIAAGMGGGTGTGAAPIVAQLARAEKALTIAVVTRPFAFEGIRRSAVAEEGIACLEGTVDTLVVVPNDRLLTIVDKRISLDVAFRIADEALRQGVQAISELVTRPGLINLDFADIRTIMSKAGGALISIGHGEGEAKVVEAARMALSSPLLNIEAVRGTEGLLVNITGGEDLTLAEVNQAMEIISEAAMPQAEILFGTIIDSNMQGRAEITVIATGVHTERSSIPKMAPTSPHTSGKQEEAEEDGSHKVVTTPATTTTTPLPPEAQSLMEIFGDELAVPAFMRSRKRIRLEELYIA
jgi:cell division protein FtsZ